MEFAVSGFQTGHLGISDVEVVGKPGSQARTDQFSLTPLFINLQFAYKLL